jgi:hypothetical protein
MTACLTNSCKDPPNVSLSCKYIRMNESGPRARRENELR